MDDRSELSAAFEVSDGDVIRPTTGTLSAFDELWPLLLEVLPVPVPAFETLALTEPSSVCAESGALLTPFPFVGARVAELAKYHQPRRMMTMIITTHILIFEFFDIYF
jgi:hypothetical protein